MNMKIKLDPGSIMPTRAHRWDAGLDLYAGSRELLFAHDRASFDTGVHVQIPAGFVGFIKSRSGMMSMHGITTDGTIDSGYTGPIKVTLFNHSNHDYIIQRGDKIAQLVILPCSIVDLIQVEELEETERGDGGFGSTGR